MSENKPEVKERRGRRGRSGGGGGGASSAVAITNTQSTGSVWGWAFLAILLLIGAIGIGGRVIADRRDQRDLVRMTEVTRQMEAQAYTEQAKADQAVAQIQVERAAGERALNESIGSAIEAPALAAARAVDSNTEIVAAMGFTNTLVTRLTILGVPILAVILVVLGLSGGVLSVIAFKWFKDWNDQQTRKREAGSDDADEDS